MGTLSEKIAVCRRWWAVGNRPWMHSVDIPADISKAEAMVVAKWVLCLESAFRYLEEESEISDKDRAEVKRIFDGVMAKWFEGVDLGLLNV